MCLVSRQQCIINALLNAHPKSTGREGEREGEGDREREREGERGREAEREREKDRERDRHVERVRHREREGDRNVEGETVRRAIGRQKERVGGDNKGGGEDV